MNYQNFDLEIISAQGDHQLYARVLESPQGDSPFVEVRWPFEAEEENEFLTDIYGGLRQRRIRSTKMATIQDFGGRLFDAVFTGDIEHLFRSSLDAAARAGKGLRLRLRLPDDSSLHSRPWEFLFDTECREFLAVREHTPLVRYLPVAQPIPPITVEGPLRILVALAAPSDHPRLDVSREWEILASALETPMAAGKVELRRVPGRCTFDNLRDSLRHYGAHIFHFIGHGIPGALVLEQESGKGLEMEASQLRSAFPSGMLPRLIVLNSCSGAIGEDVPFSGLAQGFLRQGVPAVVAMQASITDDAALIFTRYFYRDLIETGAVDTSLTEARLRMQGNGHPIEWGTPVLYMRALSGQLFQPGASPGERQPLPVLPPRDSEPLRPEPVPGDRKRHREVAARESPPAVRPEPAVAERKRHRETQKKDSPPLQPTPAAAERKRSRDSLARETLPPARPEPKPDRQTPPPKVEPILDKSVADWTVDSREPRIDEGAGAPGRPPPPPEPAPVPAEPVPEPVAGTSLKPVPEPTPTPQAPLEPAPRPILDIVPKPVEAFAPQPAPERVPPQRPQTPPKPVPGLPPKPAMEGPPRPPVDMPPKPAAQPADAAARQGKHPPWLLPVAGLLALSLAAAAVSMLLRKPPAPPPEHARSIPAPSSLPPPLAPPVAAPEGNGAATAGTALADAKPREQGKETRTAPAATEARPSASSTRKPAPSAARKPASGGIDCSNPEVAERRVECLLRK